MKTKQFETNDARNKKKEKILKREINQRSFARLKTWKFIL